MKLGVMAAGLGAMGWEKALDYCRRIGLEAIELPVGAYPGKPFFDPQEVLRDAKLQTRIRDDVRKRGLEIIGLAVHGNPVSPVEKIRREHLSDHDTAVRLARRLGTDVVINFSGCPGGSRQDSTPNWVTCSWPPEYGKVLEYQWNEVLIPFWTRKAREAADEGVKIAFEAHPGFCVYNTETLLRIRACGAPIGTGSRTQSQKRTAEPPARNLRPPRIPPPASRHRPTAAPAQPAAAGARRNPATLPSIPTSAPTSIRRTFSGRGSTRSKPPACWARPARSSTSMARTAASTRTTRASTGRSTPKATATCAAGAGSSVPAVTDTGMSSGSLS